jgi:hypothetical protein
MSVTKSVMANGSFSVTLRPDTDGTIRTDLDLEQSGFANLIVTPTALTPSDMTPTVLYGRSIFTGPVYSVEDQLTLRGHHAASWLGDPNNIGDVNERTTAVLTKTFLNWFVYVLAAQTSLTAGTIANIVPAATMAWDPLQMTPREMLDDIVDYFRSATGNPSIEWRVNDDLSVDADTVFGLYTSTPAIFLTPNYDGPDPLCPGVQADLGFTDDVEDFANRELFNYTGGGVGVSGSAGPWKDASGTIVARKKRDTDTNITAANAASHAASLVAKIDQATRQITATSRRRCILLDCPVGSYVYAWDQARDIYDLTNQVTWRGTVASPQFLRVFEITMPVEAGMGVYLHKGTTGAVVDLTRFVEWERPGATIRLESLPRRYAR